MADFGGDKAASGLEVAVPMPKEVSRVHCELPRDLKPPGSQSWDWQERGRRLLWKFRRVQGGSEHTLKVCTHAHARQKGPYMQRPSCLCARRMLPVSLPACA